MSEEKKNGLIMVVDDSQENIRLLEIILKKANYEVLSAQSGRKALDIINAVIPDLILLDVMMPQLNGYQVCKLLKKDAKLQSIPIIFLTSMSGTEDIVKGFEAGAADYVFRPFNRVELLARLKTHIDLKHSRDKVIELERKNLALAMSATANHEINQPLTVITGNLYLLKESIPKELITETQKQYLTKIDAAIIKIKELLARYRHAASMKYKQYSGNEIVLDYTEPEK
ncbi:MAG: response regulator [Calditrichaceae bacterium]|nr:response regulator [Calditrichaceae bacterium]MBN2709980.1 response regulator [Calditrichaceae bacterium]RQV97319.1 MAG: response regulator [Calditrichota bacterium]